MLYWFAYLALGAFSGILAGLLGVGGGLVIVPFLAVFFASQDLSPAYVIHVAVGTSLAVIMFTSISSLKAHHAHGVVDWQVVRNLSIGIIPGTFAGAWVAAQLSTRLLRCFFVIFLYYVALQLFFQIKPKPTRQLPGRSGMCATGALIGGVSSLVGIGGGSLSVPFMVWCNYPMQNAIGTSAAIGFPIALAGAAGYMVNGLKLKAILPPETLGFVHLPALAGVSVASMLTAPIGARLAHRLPVLLLKQIFAMLLVGMGTKMLSDLF